MNTQIKISIFILFFISVTTDSISKELKKNNYKNFTCDINLSESPDMFNFSKKVEKLFNKNYLSIYKKLNAKENQAPQKVHIIFKENLSNAGEALGDKVYLSSKWFREHPEDMGAIIHELAHVAQGYNYNDNNTFWLTEGIADYIRYDLGYKNSWSYAHCDNPSSNHYTSGYWCSAAFLEFIEKNYNKKIISYLNTALKAKKYNDLLFSKYTNKDIKTLWEECKQKNCKGVKD